MMVLWHRAWQRAERLANHAPIHARAQKAAAAKRACAEGLALQHAQPACLPCCFSTQRAWQWWLDDPHFPPHTKCPCGTCCMCRASTPPLSRAPRPLAALARRPLPALASASLQLATRVSPRSLSGFLGTLRCAASCARTCPRRSACCRSAAARQTCRRAWRAQATAASST